MDISRRPDEAGNRERTGDWEADTVIGRGHSGAVVSLVDRASKYALLQRVDQRTSAAFSAAMLEMPRPSDIPVHTITSDNGREFAGHAGVAAELGAGFHFAIPYHFWERGLNGHTNGLAPQYLPKGTDLRAVTDAEVRAVQDRADARPRRALGYRTPALPEAPTRADGRAGRVEWISRSCPSGLRSGCALPAPGRTRPAPAEALRRPESPDNLNTEGTTAVPGPAPRCPGAAGNHAFRPFPPLGLRPRCGNGRCCTSEWKWEKCVRSVHIDSRWGDGPHWRGVLA